MDNLTKGKLFMKNDEEKFKQCREDAEKYYRTITTVWCPYLQDNVHFNAEGFEHLLFKSWNKNRSQAEQYTRLRLLHLAPDVVSKSHTLQEYDERPLLVRQKINSRWEQRMKIVRYYVFVAIIKTIRLKIVVKEIEGGNKFFYSLYPAWRIEKKLDGNNKKIFYSGNPEED
ncbi:MAG: hypothetical protein HY617_00755 [Candidatus Sungbacteria bacterium]|nr:hypothetical protein [Candidatus Sungbacteria bacterium]